MTTIEPYDPFSATGAWCPATEAQCEQFSEAELERYQRLADAFNACALADRDLADCEKELRATVAASRELDAKLVSMPRMTQHDLVMQMRAVNR